MTVEIKEATQIDYDLDNADDKEMYDEMWNEGYGPVKIGSLTFDPAKIVEELDPIAYRCGFNDYVDGLPQRWECPECGARYEDSESAKWCCQDKPDDDDDDEVPS